MPGWESSKSFVLVKRHVQIIVLKEYFCLPCRKNELKQIVRLISRLLQKFLKIGIESWNQSIRSEDVGIILI